MIRTQVYLPKALYQQIKIQAAREKKPAAQIIREKIKVGMEKDQPEQTLGQALQSLIDLGKELHMTGPTDLSTNHDDYLYADKE